MSTSTENIQDANTVEQIQQNQDDQIVTQQQQSAQETEQNGAETAPKGDYHQKRNRYFKQPYRCCSNYNSLNEIVNVFPHLSSLQANLDIDSIPNALCYVIRSNNDDDVHKAIKYGIWTSVPSNNNKLIQAFQQGQQQNIDIYLFFSVVKSGQFVGVARLKSTFQDESFSFWWQPEKFKGHFKIEWVFIKDVKQKAFDKLKNCQEMDVSRSKDCTELDFAQTGKKMLQIYKEANHKPNIFQEFQYMDQREQYIRQCIYLKSQQKRMNNSNPRNNNNALFNPYLFNQQFANQQVYTQDQLEQIQQICLQNIYPPGSYSQFQNPFLMGANQQQHNIHGNNRRNFHKKPYHNNNFANKQHHQPKTQEHQLNSEPVQQRVEEQQV